jgi:superfamily II DNA or RNA helicase
MASNDHGISGLKKDVTLYPHQEKAIERVTRTGSQLLSHGTGSGKTLSALASFEKMRDEGKASKALIVTPASLRVNFIDNGVKKFTTGKAAMIGNQQEVDDGVGVSMDKPDSSARYHVVSYEMFMKDPEKVIKNTGADTVIYDELHRIRNEEGVSYDKIREARKHHKNFIGLTGSLMNNTPSDLVPLVDAMTDGKHRLGSKKQFERRFVKENVKTHEKTISSPHIVRSLLTPFVDHFETKDMQDERMPKKIIEEVRVMMSPYQEELYRYAVKKMDPVTAIKFRLGATKLKKNDIQNIFSQITQARQVSNAMHTMDLDMSLSESAKQSPKVKQLLDDAEEHMRETPDAQVVIHSNLIHGGVDVLSQGLKDRGIPFGVFVGKGQPGVNEEKRQKAVKDFNAGKNKVLVISAAGGEGLDLKNATLFSSLDGHFNPEKVQQAEARAVRAGGLAHRDPDKRQVLIKRYQSVVPRSVTQTMKDIGNLLDPMSFINRLTEPGAPLFFNPFKREQSPDEWMAGVAKSKNTLNESFRSELRKMSSSGEYDMVDETLEKVADGLFKLSSQVAFLDELEKIAASTSSKKDAVGKLQFQPYRFVKSDTPIMKKYWEDFGSHVEKMNDPMVDSLPTRDMQVKEQKYVDALRTYYREAAKSGGTAPKSMRTDVDVVKQVGKGLLGASGVAGIYGAAYAVNIAMPTGKNVARGALAGAGATLATTVPLVAWAMSKNPFFTTPKAKARKAERLEDEQLRSMLRGTSVTEEQIKKTEHFIEG